MIDLPDHLARRIRTAVTLLVSMSKDVPKAPRTVHGVISSISTGAPEAEFPADDAMLVAYLAGVLEGIATGLDVPLPALLVTAGVEQELVADQEALDHALSSVKSTARPGLQVAE